MYNAVWSGWLRPSKFIRILNQLSQWGHFKGYIMQLNLVNSLSLTSFEYEFNYAGFCQFDVTWFILNSAARFICIHLNVYRMIKIGHILHVKLQFNPVCYYSIKLNQLSIVGTILSITFQLNHFLWIPLNVNSLTENLVHFKVWRILRNPINWIYWINNSSLKLNNSILLVFFQFWEWKVNLIQWVQLIR